MANNKKAVTVGQTLFWEFYKYNRLNGNLKTFQMIPWASAQGTRRLSASVSSNVESKAESHNFVIQPVIKSFSTYRIL